MKKLTQVPSHEQLKELIVSTFLLTNKELLEGEINTELSGSTVVGVAIYNGKVLSFNVGDSRAILIKQIAADRS